jgi:hypothetical protein
MEQHPRTPTEVDHAAARDRGRHRCLPIVWGWALFLGGVAAWVASDVLYRALPRSSVAEIVVWVAAWESLAFAAIIMLGIALWLGAAAQLRRVGVQQFRAMESLPELEHVPPEQRGQVLQTCRSRRFREWRSWIGCIMIVLTGGSLSYFTITMHIEPHGLILTGLVGGMTGGAIGEWGMHRTRWHLRDYLNHNRCCTNRERE